MEWEECWIRTLRSLLGWLGEKFEMDLLAGSRICIAWWLILLEGPGRRHLDSG
jgi:hypothetical protein